MSAPHSMTIDDAAAYTGVSKRRIWAAIASGDLVARYPTSRPVIPVAELAAWIDSRPTESPRRRSA